MARPAGSCGQGWELVVLRIGVFPGFASDQLALVLATQSKKIDRITVTEVSLNDHYPVADVMMDGMGFGRPLDFEPMLKTPGFIEMAWKAPIHLIADALGAEVPEIRGSLDRRITERDIEVAFGTIAAGTCGAVCTRATGVVNGREAIVIEHIIRMSRDVAPDWPASEFDATYRVDIEGDPDIHCAMNLGRPKATVPPGRDGCHRDAGSQCDSLRCRCSRRIAELARSPEYVAAVCIGLVGRLACDHTAQAGVTDVDLRCAGAQLPQDVLGYPAHADDRPGQHLVRRTVDVDLSGLDGLGEKRSHLLDALGEQPAGVRGVRGD